MVQSGIKVHVHWVNDVEDCLPVPNYPRDEEGGGEGVLHTHFETSPKQFYFVFHVTINYANLTPLPTGFTAKVDHRSRVSDCSGNPASPVIARRNDEATGRGVAGPGLGPG
jgi:hypothetical protein